MPRVTKFDKLCSWHKQFLWFKGVLSSFYATSYIAVKLCCLLRVIDIIGLDWIIGGLARTLWICCHSRDIGGLAREVASNQAYLKFRRIHCITKISKWRLQRLLYSRPISLSSSTFPSRLTDSESYCQCRINANTRLCPVSQRVARSCQQMIVKSPSWSLRNVSQVEAL